MVVSRKCPLCGHHEIGFVTEDGEFHPLSPGTMIRVGESPSPGEALPQKSMTPVSTQAEGPVTQKLWIPEPLRGDRKLRLKYGVMANEHLFKGQMSGELYEVAYVEKLERLVDKVVHVPLPVILDRFFSAPHLSSGNSRQVAEAMYRELDEVQRPVALMKAWLEQKDAWRLEELIAPKPVKELGHEPAGDETVKKELEELTLEEFLEML
jgi:hypothetical protein